MDRIFNFFSSHSMCTNSFSYSLVYNVKVMRADTQKIQLCLENYLFDDRNIFMPMIDVFLRKFFFYFCDFWEHFFLVAYFFLFLRKLNFRTFLFSLTRYISSRLGQWIVDDCDLVLALNAVAVSKLSAIHQFWNLSVHFKLCWIKLNWKSSKTTLLLPLMTIMMMLLKPLCLQAWFLSLYIHPHFYSSQLDWKIYSNKFFCMEENI